MEPLGTLSFIYPVSITLVFRLLCWIPLEPHVTLSGPPVQLDSLDPWIPCTLFTWCPSLWSFIWRAAPSWNPLCYTKSEPLDTLSFFYLVSITLVLRLVCGTPAAWIDIFSNRNSISIVKHKDNTVLFSLYMVKRTALRSNDVASGS